MPHFRPHRPSQDSGPLIFEWYAGSQAQLSHHIADVLSGNYDHRHPFDVWRQDKVIHSDDLPVFDACIRGLDAGHKSGEMTIRLHQRSGMAIWYRIIWTRQDDTEGKAHYMAIVSNVDEAQKALYTLRFRAEFDPLTGAYNMPTFLEKAANLVKNHEAPYTIVRFKVEGFKIFNERYGLAEGDRLLRGISVMVRDSLRKDREIFARLSAKFTVCLYGGESRVRTFTQELADAIAIWSGDSFYRLIFGICPVDDSATPIHVFCDRAQAALKSIEGNDLSNSASYDSEMLLRHQENIAIKENMHSSLQKEEFQIYFQPKVDIANGRIIGCEALARWPQSGGGMIPPDRFIPLFESSGFILHFDIYVWEHVCKNLRHWLDVGLEPLPASINVSRLHFQGDELSHILLALVEKYDIPPRLLELEVTESAFFENEHALVQSMRHLQEFGFRFSMDDFGTGYSSLSALRTLPFNIIKLDRVFLGDPQNNRRGRILAEDIVAITRKLGMDVIAEGVETEEQALFLLGIGCRWAQGYYYARPMLPDAFEQLWIQTGGRLPVPPAIRAEAVRLGLTSEG
ncbi:MAG: EAL domain-containing protein [Desulfovibrio sp.]|nr:EAL domain-containing protein [Desulfovibrio sp.]